jgi:hypothetical protein
MKKTTFNELFFKIQNFVEITGRNDAGCDFVIGSTLHQSKAFLQMDQWMHLALVGRAS